MLGDDIHSLTKGFPGFLQEKEFNPLENNLEEEVADFLITVSFVNIKNTL